MRQSRYLTPTDRQIIERLYKQGRSCRYIARFLEVSSSTVSCEVRRGLVELLDGDTWLTYKTYSAQKGQQIADWNKTAKGRPLKIGNDHVLAAYIENEILSKKSPAVVIAQLSARGKRPFSVNTLYRYIDQGLFLHISNADLFEKPRRKRPYHKVHVIKNSPAGRSIESRPDNINNREEFGHWEMDCVIGKAKGKGQAHLTLTERLTRYEIVVRLKSKSSASVVHALDRLQRKYDFPNIFRTITVDNGSEFSDCQGMEHDRRGRRRTTVYYCHPYTSCERGTNERMNRMLRRFFPKGSDFSKTTQAQCDAAADWLNHYPRKVLGYKTPAELFEYYTSKQKFL